MWGILNVCYSPFCFYLQSLDLCKLRFPAKHDLYVAMVGSLDEMEDCALMCDQKVMLRISLGSNIASMALILTTFCHIHHLKFSSEVTEVTEFLQTKLLGISERRKCSVAYSNLFRAVSNEEGQAVMEISDSQSSFDSDQIVLAGSGDVIQTQVSLYLH